MIKRILIATACLSTALAATAQDVVFRGQNYADRFSVAPAFAGFNGNDEAFVSYRRNMYGIEGAPKNMRIDVNGDIMNQNAGYGIDITSEKSGNFTNLSAAITYAYHIRFSSDASLSLAVSPTLLRVSYNLAKATTTGMSTDPVFQSESGLSATAFDAGVSLMFNYTNLYFSAAMPRTICKEMNFANGIYNYDRMFYGELSYAIPASSKITLEPIADVLYYTKGGLEWKASLAAKYNQRAWLTLSYSSQYWVGIGAGFAAGSRIAVSYLYETGNSTIASNCMGTHEITVGFCISKNQTRKEPTAFADDDLGSSTIIQNDNSDLERKLQEEIRTRDSEIKRLEDMIQEYNSKLPQNNGDVTPSNPGTGYTPPTENPSVQEPEPQSDSQEWQAPVQFNNVVFSFGNAKLLPSSNSEIDRCVNKLKKSDNLKVKIIAYTDELGSSEYCRILSMQRAEAIKKYITGKGIADSRVVTEGRGKRASGGSVTTEQRISLNRVEYCWSK